MNSTTQQKPRVAFLGIGIMGAGMARRLLGAGHPLAAWNRSRAKAEALAADGAVVASTPAEAARGADIVITMLAEDTAARAAWQGRDGALSAVQRGALLVEASTISVEWALELAAAAAERGCEFLDTPVTASKPEAESGKLRFLIGGDAATLDRHRPFFEVMGTTLLHIGPAGSGARMKLINNFLAGVQLASLAEAMAMIERTGIDRKAALEVLLNGAPGSPLIKLLAARMVERDYATRFPVRLMGKDLDYSGQEGRRHGVPMIMARAAREVFQIAIDAGWGEKDFSSIVEPLRGP